MCISELARLRLRHLDELRERLRRKIGGHDHVRNTTPIVIGAMSRLGS